MDEGILISWMVEILETGTFPFCSFEMEPIDVGAFSGFGKHLCAHIRGLMLELKY